MPTRKLLNPKFKLPIKQTEYLELKDLMNKYTTMKISTIVKES